MHLHPLSTLQKHAACLSQSGLRTSVLEVQSVSERADQRRAGLQRRLSCSLILTSGAFFFVHYQDKRVWRGT